MKKSNLNLSLAAGTAMVLSLSHSAVASMGDNPFAVEEVGQGLRVAEAAQGQCGEGSGGKSPTAAEARCGAEKTGMKDADGSAGEMATMDKKAKPAAIREASCGEAKCGSGQ